MKKSIKAINTVVLILAMQAQLNVNAEEKIENLVIIGGGIAGLTAGIQASLAKLEPIIITGKDPGVIGAAIIGNWPGDPRISGAQLIEKLRNHAQQSSCRLINAEVASIDIKTAPFTIQLIKGIPIKTKAIIIATGTSPKKLGCSGEQTYWGRGVAICSMCDGPLYENKEVIIVGNGNSALHEALSLSKYTQKITVITHQSCLNAKHSLQEKVRQKSYIRLLFNTRIDAIEGDSKRVNSIRVTDTTTNKSYTIPANGIFVSVGVDPNNVILSQQLKLDNHGYISTTDGTQTSIPGIFAAGNICSHLPKQAITAAGSGCLAAIAAERFLNNNVRTAEQKCPGH